MAAVMRTAADAALVATAEKASIAEAVEDERTLRIGIGIGIRRSQPNSPAKIRNYSG